MKCDLCHKEIEKDDDYVTKFVTAIIGNYEKENDVKLTYHVDCYLQRFVYQAKFGIDGTLPHYEL